MTKAATPNYTDAQVTILRDMYTPVRSEPYPVRKAMVKEIADLIDKKEASVRAKLGTMVTDTGERLYRANEPVSNVTGGEPMKKSELAVEINTLSDLDLDVEAMENTSKTNLVKLRDYFRAAAAETDPVETD